MTKLHSLSLCSMASLCLVFASPALVFAQDADAGKPAESAPANKKPKKGSRPPKETTASAPAAPSAAGSADPLASDNSGMTPEQIIDLYTGGKPASGAGSAPGGVSTPPSYSAPAADDSTAGGSPSAGGAPGSLPPSGADSLPPSGADNLPSLPQDSAPPSSSSADGNSGPSTGPDGETVIDEDNKIPSNTLRAGELNNQAVDALNAKDFEKAIILLRQALVYDPKYQQGRRNLRVAYFNQAVELYNNQKYSECIPILEKAMALSKEIGSDMPEVKSMLDDCRDAVKSNGK